MSKQFEPAERRENERVKLHKRVEFKPAGMEKYERAVILNQSEGGMLLSTQLPMVIDTYFEIDLVPLGHRERHPFVGQVVHIEEDHSRAWWGGHQSSYHYGCRITSTDSEEQVALETTDKALLDTTQSYNGGDELRDHMGYEVIDLTDVVEADYNTLIAQVDDLIATARDSLPRAGYEKPDC